MSQQNCDKLIIAIVQGDDYYDAIAKLNQEGYYATVLNSTGGFLRKKSVTLMIGVNHQQLEGALEILRQFGKRTETIYSPPLSAPASPPCLPLPPRCLSSAAAWCCLWWMWSSTPASDFPA